MAESIKTLPPPNTGVEFHHMMKARMALPDFCSVNILQLIEKIDKALVALGPQPQELERIAECIIALWPQLQHQRTSPMMTVAKLSPQDCPTRSIGGFLSCVMHALGDGCRIKQFIQHPPSGFSSTKFRYSVNGPRKPPTKMLKKAACPVSGERRTLMDSARENESEVVAHMKKLRWVFDPKIDTYMGMRVRRFWPAFGFFDGSVRAYLPAYRDGGPLYRVFFDDTLDYADMDLEELLMCRRWHETNTILNPFKVSWGCADSMAAPAAKLPAIECYLPGSPYPGVLGDVVLRRIDCVDTASALLRLPALTIWLHCEHNEAKARGQPLCGVYSALPSGVSFRFAAHSANASAASEALSPEADSRVVAAMLDSTASWPEAQSDMSSLAESGVECLSSELRPLHRFRNVHFASQCLGFKLASRCLTSEPTEDLGFKWRLHQVSPGENASNGAFPQYAPLRLVQAMCRVGESSWHARGMASASERGAADLQGQETSWSSSADEMVELQRLQTEYLRRRDGDNRGQPLGAEYGRGSSSISSNSSSSSGPALSVEHEATNDGGEARWPVNAEQRHLTERRRQKNEVRVENTPQAASILPHTPTLHTTHTPRPHRIPPPPHHLTILNPLSAFHLCHIPSAA